MDAILFTLGSWPVTLREAALGGGGAALLLLLAMFAAMLRAGRLRREEAAAAAERQHELDDKMAALAQQNGELAGRLATMTEIVATRQADLARLMAERLDKVGERVGQGLEHSARSTADHLAKLGERLATIDRAQANLATLSQDMLGLKDILSNKQARGAFGQGRMEAIVRDALPASAYAFQATLSNRSRPDCVLRLPGDPRVMAIDAKFPLEAFTALREADDDDSRRRAAQRVRQDVGKHVRDIAERYLLPGETQDVALLFVPSESIYADLIEHFDDVTQKAHRARVLIVSPSLLLMAIQLVQAMVRDARMQENAHLVFAEVGALLEDVRRLQERVTRLDGHFRQAQGDLETVSTSANKIARRGERMLQIEVDEACGTGADFVPAVPRAAQ
ncbi:MAG TPA: DNA recombination protein RmuC [Beijerinckiaceae bacterium]|jgi:DNA recombination protein RmuC